MDARGSDDAADRPSPFDRLVERWRSGQDLTALAAELVAQMTPAEALALLEGDVPFWEGRIRSLAEGSNTHPVVGARCERLGVPGLAFVDGPRGVAISPATCFPVSMARGATFDPELEEAIGEAIGQEVRARGGDFFGGVCVNLLRHPGWGRSQETYGEDPHHVGQMGVALMLGAQRHVMACVKHFALNSMETSRFRVDVQVDERALHEVYLPHFRCVVDAGVASVMAAYNRVNGEWCCESVLLLEDVLREEWDFDGIVISDFIFGVRDAAASVIAGLDVEMPYRMVRGQHLAAAISDGRVSWSQVHAIAQRVVRTLARFADLRGVPMPPPDVIACDEHVALARRAALESIVVLENRGVLPLDPGRTDEIVVVGRLARVANLGDGGSSDVRPPHVVTPLDGIRAAFPAAHVVHVDDVAESAGHDPVIGRDGRADVAIVVVGYTRDDEGEYLDLAEQIDLMDRLAPPFTDDQQRARFERLVTHPEESRAEPPGGDRRTLRLPADQEDLIVRTAARHRRTVVVLMAGGAVVTEAWREHVDAVVMLWYPGMEGGNALGDVLSGRVAPSGHLPFAVPIDECDLPPFEVGADRAEYGLLHGQWWLDAHGAVARYPFGHGESYTVFRPVSIDVEADGDGVVAHVRWRNDGPGEGADVVQLYASVPGSPVVRPDRRLVGFSRIHLAAGDIGAVAIRIDREALRRRDAGRWVWEDRAVVIEAARWAGDADAVRWQGRVPPPDTVDDVVVDPRTRQEDR